MKRLFTFIVLIGLNLGLLGLIVQIEVKHPKQQSFQAPGALGLNFLDIRQVLLDQEASGSPLLLQKEGNDWKCIRPQTWPVDKFFIENLLRELQFLKVKESIPLETPEKQEAFFKNYGLGAQSLKIELVDSQGARTQLQLGFLKKPCIYKAGSTSLLVLEEGALEPLNKPLKGFLQKKLFDEDLAFAPKKIVIKHADGALFELEKQGESWSLQSPFKAHLDTQGLELSLGRLAQAPINLDLDPPLGLLAQPELEPPAVSITFFTQNYYETLYLSPIQDDPKLYWAKRDTFGLIFRLEADVVADFQNPLERWRSPFLFDFDGGRETVMALEIIDAGRTVRIAQDETAQWRVYDTLAQQPLRADLEVWEKCLQELKLLRAEGFGETHPSSSQLRDFGLAPPRRTLKVENEAGSQVLLLGTKQPGTRRVYAQLEGQPCVCTVPELLLERFPANPSAYRSRLLKKYPDGSELVAVKVTEIDTEKTLFESSAEQKHFFQDALQAPVLAFKARDYPANATFDQKGIRRAHDETLPWRYRVEIKIKSPQTREDALNILTFVTTRRVGANLQYATMEGLLFTLEQVWIDFLNSLLDEPKKHHGQP